MNFSVPISRANFSNAPQRYPNCMSYSEYENLNLLKLLSFALSASVSAYSNFRCQENEVIIQQIDDSSVIEIEKPLQNYEIKESPKIQKGPVFSQILKGQELNKEESVGIADTEKPPKQIPSISLNSPHCQQNEGIVEEFHSSVELEEEPQDWEKPINCPGLGIRSSQIQRKKMSLLQRQVFQWGSGNKGGKRKKVSELRSRQIRMLFD